MMRMQSLSLLKLILLGFFVVALPLVGAIVTAINQVDKLAQDSGRALVAVQKNTGISRMLASRVTEMERSARQFHALGDQSYYDLYNKHRDDVIAILHNLRSASTPQNIQQLLAKTEQSEAAVFAFVEAGEGVSMQALTDTFAILREDVLEIVRLYNTLARDMSNAMPERADNLQSILVGQAVLVIPLSVGLAIVFVVAIARPLRQIDQGIRSLGHGFLSEPIKVSGPKDFEYLGSQLDYLRIRLIELEAQKTQFLRNVSHELKTPLTNIREGTELLRSISQESQDHEQQTIARILRENSVRLQRMIEELLRFGTDGEITSKSVDEPLELDRLVKKVVDKHELALASRNIELVLDVQPIVVSVDRKRISIVVDNLVNNAVKYAPQFGMLKVNLRVAEHGIHLDILDNGPGVQENEKDQIFDWFFIGQKPQDAIIAGTGMGLAIAQEYARQHQGRIELLDSEQGAHFRLILPLARMTSIYEK